MRVVEQQERRDKKDKKDKKEKKEKKRMSSKKSSAAADGDTSSDDDVLPLTCKYCIKYSKTQHPTRITPDNCMWNKKVRKFRFNSVCRKMNLKFIEGSKFKTGKEDTKIIDGVGDMETMIYAMMMDGPR
jgi:hypothetical protein